MSYGRQTLMNALRKAGDRVNEFDRAYAARAAKDMGAIESHPIRHMLGGSAISEIGEVQADSMVERLLGETIAMGARGTNLGYRYGLPTAGVTLAGKGLFDVTQGLYAAASATPVFGGPEDGQQPGQLPLS